VLKNPRMGGKNKNKNKNNAYGGNNKQSQMSFAHPPT
jgi:hypothetical protein